MKQCIRPILAIAAVAAISSFATFGLTNRAIGQEPKLDAESVRQIIVQANKDWGKARTSYDKKAFEETLSKDFYVLIGERKMTRAEFIDQISRQQPNSKLVRFDVDVLTVMPGKDGIWDAVIAEKLEGESTAPDGTKSKTYSLWITKDGWKQEGNKWVAMYSEAIGFQFWGNGKKPPFADW